ncbi:MAG: TonB-dependent receptor [Bacteroidetes bacterium]|nr:TonB-dependent receptor [Bacteroidota bacterium]
MKKAGLHILFLFILQQVVFAQKDTANLEDVVVTATRTERKVGNVAVPVTIITNKNIKQAASLRLNDILNEQTGIFINDIGFGTGIQMQGLSADYSLILLNGEPLIGRNSGVLDLKRIAVGNIQKIEIVRGPSSSLYGSEAMAGVINLITKEDSKNKLSASLRYGSFETFDASASAYFKINKTKIQLFSNAFHTQLYSVRPFSVEKNLEPLWKYNHQIYISNAISNKTKLTLLARYSLENFTTKFATTNLGTVVYSDGFEKHIDYAINPTITHQFSNKIKSVVRFYHSNYESNQDLATTSTKDYYDYFRQRLYKLENQTDFNITKKLNLITGIGYIYENAKSSRYDSERSLKESKVGYAFLQTEYNFNKKFTAIGGVRYDNNSNYASAVSPKISCSYRPNAKWHFTASAGYGFKAPDFRQLYLNFTNTAAGGYTVLGALEAVTKITQLQQQGLIANTTSEYNKLKTLKPETSLGINIGAAFQPNTTTKISVNFFRNNLDNLIEYAQVASYNGGAQIYSYINLNKAFTKGVELNVAHKISKTLFTNFGYQLLFSGNTEEVDKIKQGLIYTRDANGISRKLEMSEYFGLTNRSRHTANFKLQYEKNNFYCNARVMYHSRWAVADKDGNGVYNTNDEFASGYLQLNLTAGYNFKKHYTMQVGCNNITNYSDFNYLPTLMGRNFFISINYN